MAVDARRLLDLGRPAVADARVRIGLVAFGVMALAQIAIPLTPVGDRAGLSSLVVVALAVVTAAFTAACWGWARAVTTLAVVSVIALAVEVVGSRTGFPFGSYDYTGVLRPEVAGVPAIVPLAWFGMGVPAWAVARRLVGSLPARIAVAAVALTAWDLFLDPQMVTEGYWVWPGGGLYRGIPLTNFAGWLLASAVVMAAIAAVTRDAPRPAGVDVWLVGVYTWMAVMETIGFLVFFRDPLVGVVGGVVMVPLAVAAWRAGPAGG